MITQRERLAAVLFDIRWGDNDNEVLTELRNASTDDDPLDYEEEWSMTPLAFADALIARGVRAIDRELLEEVTINRCATPEAASGCEPCQRGAMELVDFLNDQEDVR